METLGTDEVIVQRALGGDAEAFGELVARWERRIFALTYGLLGRATRRRRRFWPRFAACAGFAARRKSRRGCIALPLISA